MKTGENSIVACGFRALAEGYGDPEPRGLPVGPRRMYGGSAEGGWMTEDEEYVADALSREVFSAADKAIKELVSTGMNEEDAVRWVSRRIETLALRVTF